MSTTAMYERLDSIDYALNNAVNESVINNLLTERDALITALRGTL